MSDYTFCGRRPTAISAGPCGCRCAAVPAKECHAKNKIIHRTGCAEQWGMLDGYFTQQDKVSGRDLFCLVRAFLASKKDELALVRALKKQSMRGRWLPEKPAEVYAYAGEFPWCSTFDTYPPKKLRFVTDRKMITVMRRRTIMKTGIAGEEISKALYLIQAGKPIPKELTGSVARNVSTELVPTQESREKAIEFKVSFPVCDFHWEGPTIDDVRASGVFIAKPIAQALKLRWIPGTHDVADAHGRRATCNTAYGEGGRENGQQAFFVREDLLNNYLHRTKQVLIWVSWGERGIAHHLVDYVRENRKDFGQPFKVFHTVKVLRPTKGQL